MYSEHKDTEGCKRVPDLGAREVLYGWSTSIKSIRFRLIKPRFWRDVVLTLIVPHLPIASD